MKKCKKCGLNPNDEQPEEQQKWELDYIREHGICSACQLEVDENNETYEKI